MTIRLAAFASILLALPAVAQEAVSLDQLIDNERFQLKRDCSTAELRPDFAMPVDINGDGLDDIQLDFSAVECDGLPGRFCSNNECRKALYLQTSAGTFTLLLRTGALNIAFDRPNGQWPSFIVERNGTECNLTAAETCLLRYEIRNGQARQIRNARN
ncbi:MAG: hypothetical protein WBA44_06110 [Mesorhizobium sp.]